MVGFILLLIALDKSSISEIKNAITKNGGTVIEIEHIARKKSPFKNTTKGDKIHKVKYINSKGENKEIYIKNGDVRGIDW